MSERRAKKTRKLNIESKKLLLKVSNKKNRLIEKAIRFFMEKNNLTINDIKTYGTLTRENNGTEIYKYNDETIIKIKIVYENKKIKLNVESEYIIGEKVNHDQS